MKILFDYIIWIGKRISRHLYWLYRLSKIKFGKDKKLHFPIRIEGKGNLSFGNACEIEKHVKLGVSDDSRLEFDKSAHLEQNSTILVGHNASLKVSENFKLGAFARLFVKSHWVLGQNVSIQTYCSIFAREPKAVGKLEIGNNSNIGDYTIIDVVDDVIIGNNVAIGPNCTLYTHDHIYTDRNVPAWKGGLVSKPIIIEDGAWVGSGVTILPGVNIGKRAVVAAGSVVTKSVEPNTIYGGIPAKFIKEI